MPKCLRCQIAAVALHHEQPHMRIVDMSGFPDVSLPTLGVSSLDLGRSCHRAAPSFSCDASDLVRPRARPLLAVTVFCNAKGFACILCAAHLDKSCEAGDFVAGLVALLGRFLPRLGPHGPPRGPFYFLAGARVRPKARGPAQRLRRDATMPSSPASTRRSIAALSVLRCNITRQAVLGRTMRSFRRRSPLEQQG
jgi:hypothetical protein